MNNKFFKFRKARQWIFALSAFMFVFAACNDDDDTKSKTVHDPNKPVELTSFKPDSGRIAEMVILDGSNFGSDISKIKVFFNSKEARVLGSTGTRLLALVPRLPGDNCVISVTVDDRSYAYDAIFRYKMEASVSTWAGDGNNPGTPVYGSRDKSSFRPLFLGIDKDDNIFVTINPGNMLLKLNDDDNSITVLATEANHGLDYHSPPCIHPGTGELLLGSGTVINRDLFLTLDPKDDWAPKNRYIKNWNQNGYSMPSGTVEDNRPGEDHYVCLYCEADECYYTRYASGQLVKIDPKTWDAEIIYKVTEGRVYGMAFHPVRKTELWIAYSERSIPGNGLYRIDVANPTSTFEKMSLGGAAGFRDGPLANAQFNSIRMINFDSEGNLFVVEAWNHCVRKIDTQTMMVETIIGIPGILGFKDGKRDDALFYAPHGLVVTSEGVIYIAEYENCRIRRIAIE